MVKQDKPINNTDYVGLRYIIKNEDFGKFEAILASNMMTKFNCENNKEGLDKIASGITAVCNKAFKVPRGVKHLIKKTIISWWTEEWQNARSKARIMENVLHDK
jgi:hypothetical protein